jgi:hypothetical protein
VTVTDKQKRYALIGGAGLLLLFLLYRYYSSRSGQSSSTAATGATAAPDTSGSDYATLAGQEQGDVAGLQSQEQSDAAAAQTGLSALTGQEGIDFSGVSDQISGLTGQIQNLTDLQSSLSSRVAGIAIGTTPVSQAHISTHKGGPFYNYYVRVTGKAPPASVATSNFIYEAWKSGVKATALAPKKPAKHPSSNNTHVAHPNGNHEQKAGTTHPNHPAASTAPARKPTPPAPTKPAPKQTAKKPPPPKTKPKASAPRK